MDIRNLVNRTPLSLQYIALLLLGAGMATVSVSAAPVGSHEKASFTIIKREAVLAEDGYVYHEYPGASATYSGNGSSLGRYNPSGEDIAVTRIGLGSYEVMLSASFFHFVPTVTAFSANGSYCKVVYFSYPGDVVQIHCSDASGNPTDSAFSLRWTSTQEDAYAFIGTYGIITSVDNNPWGSTQVSNSISNGNFVVSTPGAPNFKQGQVHVTSTYGGIGVHCKVTSQGASTASIGCYDSNGGPASSSFTFLRIGSADDAFAFANDSLSTSTYVTDTNYSHNPQGGDPTSQNIGTGEYLVTFPGLQASYGGNIQVTAFGPGSAKCAVSGWTATTVNVSCSDSSGVPTNSQFNVLYTRFQTCAGMPANVEIGNTLPSTGDDVIVGTSGADNISGLGGDDVICGMNGEDTVYGGPGKDVLYGGDGQGNDDTFNTLYGGSGDDSVFGSEYDDFLYGQGGADYLVTLNTSSGLGDVMSGGSGNDVLHSNSTAGSDMRGNGNNDTLYGSAADDVIKGDTGLDTIYGNGGSDLIQGGNGADTIYGGVGPDTIYGQGARDYISGGSGDDVIYGGLGNDSIDGGVGSDYCNGQGQDSAAGDTETNCETTIGFPVVPQSVILFRPGRVSFDDLQLLAIDKCDLTAEQCLKK